VHEDGDPFQHRGHLVLPAELALVEPCAQVPPLRLAQLPDGAPGVLDLGVEPAPALLPGVPAGRGLVPQPRGDIDELAGEQLPEPLDRGVAVPQRQGGKREVDHDPAQSPQRGEPDVRRGVGHRVGAPDDEHEQRHDRDPAALLTQPGQRAESDAGPDDEGQRHQPRLEGQLDGEAERGAQEQRPHRLPGGPCGGDHRRVGGDHRAERCVVQVVLDLPADEPGGGLRGDPRQGGGERALGCHLRAG
jgi:hypothetical protein